jgi:hypothetical protein
MWFKPNLASPGAVTSDDNIIVFVCGLDQTSLHRGSKPHTKMMMLSFHVAVLGEAMICLNYIQRQ